jgi:transposase
MTPELWAEIRRLHEIERCSLSEISRRLQLDRKTVRRALQSEHIPHRTPAGKRSSKLDAYKQHITQRLKDYPRIPASALYDEIVRMGYSGKIRIVREYVAGLRVKKKEVYLRIETLPGEYAQVDWANCGSVHIGACVRKLSCFVMVLSYSRMMYLEFRLSQRLEDFVQCHVNAFQFFGGVPHKILYDNVKTVVLSRLGKDLEFNPRFIEFAGIFLFAPICCNPGRGNEKGKVECGIKYIRSSLLSGITIRWPDIQTHAVQWRDGTANVRIHATTRQRPVDRLEHERAHLLALPSKEYDASIPQSVAATHQALVRFDGNSYSVPYTKAYAMLVVKATLQEVRVYDGMKCIAVHKRSFERGVVIEEPKHYAGLLTEKKKAMASKLKDQFLNLGSVAQNYLEGLLKQELNLAHHIKAILDLARLYGKTEVLQAMERACVFSAYGAPYLTNIILQQRAARGVRESVPISIPSKPSWTQVSVEQQDLGLYDDLCNDDSTDESEVINEQDT